MTPAALLLLKVTLLLGAAWAFTHALRRQSADLRHRIWALALGGALLLPILTAALPGWHAGAITSAIARATDPFVTAPLPRALSPMIVNAVPARATAVGLIGFVWLSGTVILLLRLARGLIVLAWISSRACTMLHNGCWFGALDAARQLGITRPVRLLESHKAQSMPLTWGFLRPAILLPSEARLWDETRRKLVLLHESAHIARADWPIQILAEVARAVYWFHPLVWLAANRVRQESEQAADDAVLNSGIPPADYATQLLDLARTLKNTNSSWSTALAMARTTNLERRFTAMLNPSLNRRRASGPAALVTTVAALALLLPLAALKSPAQDRAGKFTGSVLDPRNAPISNATIILANPKSGTKDMTTSDSAGHYAFNGLPAGDYQMSVLQPGFVSYAGPISLAPTQDSARDVSLLLGPVNESFEVTADGQAPRRLRIGGSVQATKLIHKVNPVYPVVAKQARSQGSVLLQGLIGKDGRLSALSVLNSQIDPELAKASVEAVQQWVYEPTLLNGEPIEVVTNITVNFTLMP